MVTPKAPMRAAELIERLRRHYLKPGPFPGGVFVTEVGQNGPAHEGGRMRRCDAVHVGFTSTSGRLLTGHEVKVSRADWLHELAQPHKADRWADQCHAWYVVAPDADIVRPDELPPDWGLLVVQPHTKTSLRRVVRAREHPERVPAWWAVRSVLARHDTLTERTINERVSAETERRVAQSVAAREQMAQVVRSRHARLADALTAELGDDLRYTDPDALAKHVVAVLNRESQDRDAERQTQWAAQNVRNAIRGLTDVLQTLTGAPHDTAAG